MVKNVIIAILSLLIIFLIVKSHWGTADLSPLATIVGAIITGLITWFAIYETSKLDRKNRKIENTFKYFEDKIIKLASYIPNINKLNAKYFDGKEGKANIINDDIISKELNDINKVKSVLESILLHNPPEKSSIESFIMQLEEFRKTLEYIQIKHRSVANEPYCFIKKDPIDSSTLFIFFDDLHKNVKEHTSYNFEKLNAREIDNF